MSSDANERKRGITEGIQIAAASEPIKTSASKALRDREERRHSREDALSDRQFEILVDATYRMKDSQRLEARTALYLAGKCGLRGGEIAHLTEDWVDWSEKIIEIPEHETCTKGVNEGEICGYCRRRAIDELTTNNLTIEEAENAVRYEFDEETLRELGEGGIRETALQLRDEVNITFKEAVGRRWKPKTPNSAREVPFDFDVRVQLCLEEFFDRYSSWEKSKSTVNRRVNRIAEIADIDARVYPHSLRATAASLAASRDISAYSMMSMFGWVSIETARAYIRSNSKQANREIRSKSR